MACLRVLTLILQSVQGISAHICRGQEGERQRNCMEYSSQMISKHQIMQFSLHILTPQFYEYLRFISFRET